MKTRALFFVSILMVLLIPATDAKPVIIGFEERIEKINAPLTWNNSTGNNVKIAVLDTGISNSHPDLTVSGGINLAGKSKKKKWDDDNGHGTHVAGIIAAKNNSIGVVGTAPDAELFAVKMLDAYGSGYISDVIEGIDWAVQNNMDIVSMSLGTATYSQALDDATANANNSGVLLVAAAGNNGDGNLSTHRAHHASAQFYHHRHFLISSAIFPASISGFTEP